MWQTDGLVGSSHLPGTLSGGTRKLIQETITNMPEMRYEDSVNFGTTLVTVSFFPLPLSRKKPRLSAQRQGLWIWIKVWRSYPTVFVLRSMYSTCSCKTWHSKILCHKIFHLFIWQGWKVKLAKFSLIAKKISFCFDSYFVSTSPVFP